MLDKIRFEIYMLLSSSLYSIFSIIGDNCKLVVRTLMKYMKNMRCNRMKLSHVSLKNDVLLVFQLCLMQPKYVFSRKA